MIFDAIFHESFERRHSRLAKFSSCILNVFIEIEIEWEIFGSQRGNLNHIPQISYFYENSPTKAFLSDTNKNAK